MKQLLILLILLALSFGIGAQASPYQDSIDRSRTILSADPDDVSERLNLAWYLMLSGFPELALPEYRKALQLDPASADAAAGKVWALIGLQQWDQAEAETRKQLARHPGSALLSHYRADAMLRLGYPLSARHWYRKAERRQEDPYLRQLSTRGLSWAYNALGDHPNSAAQLKKCPDQDLNYPLEFIRKRINQTHVYAEIAYGGKDGDTGILSALVLLKHRSLALRFGFEELQISGTHFRSAIGAGINAQFQPLDLDLSLRHLQGEDDRVYPGVGGSLTLVPKIYVSPILIKPRLAQHASRYERFDIHQSDLGLSLNHDRLGLSYGYSSLYQDVEIVDADTTGSVHALSAYLKVYRGSYLGAYYGTGDLAWFINSAGSVIDDFEPVKYYLGASLYAPLSRKFGLTLYYQYGSRNDDPSNYFSLKLSYGS